MAQRYTKKTSFTATPEIQDSLDTVAERFNTSVSKIIRECVEQYLPTLVETYKEREKHPNPLSELDLNDE